jgi:hypothetical protein
MNVLKTLGMTEKDSEPDVLRRRKIAVFGRKISMPHSRPLRITMGVLLTMFGIVGFLPVLGFWMVPLGLLVLSHELSSVRRLRRRGVVWWERRQRSKK